MDSKIKVSVIIPVYQVENYLERAIDSVISQTLEDKEIILVDDGSTDCSPDICDRYARDYPDLVRVIHKENEGLGMARNTGVEMASGEYIAFLDSDDTVENTMYERMYEKAIEGNYDIVMCDVKIIYVEENKEKIICSYSKEEIDVSDYIANGNNITYSVNKLFKREIWEQNRYEKMLFEDISLIPSLVSRYENIGYVNEAFYNYYRRANTISTTFIGNMVDIIKAFRNFIKESNPDYREEVVYCIAKQLYWNINQSRTIFKADFIDFINEYKRYFLLNSYIQKDKKISELLDFIDKDIIPDNIICVHYKREIPDIYLDNIESNFPSTRIISVDENYFSKEELPENINRAISEEKFDYIEEYFALRTLCKEGGIVINTSMKANLNLKRLRLNRIFFGFEDHEELNMGCYGALKNHYVIQLILDSYEEDNIFNRAFLPLSERIRDFLVINFGLRVNGRNQFLKNEIKVYLPSILAYDMKDGENCCKNANIMCLPGYEVIKDGVLKMWSERILTNWNLYKSELKNNGNIKPIKNIAKIKTNYSNEINKEVNQRIKEVIDNYESSTCWRITKPIRAIAELMGKERRKK